MDSAYSVWAVYDILEVTRGFLREGNPEVADFIAYGIENLNLTSLNTVGITKIIKIPSNIVDLHDPLNEETLTFEKISQVLGEKCKMPITDYLDPRKKLSIQMKQWKGIWIKGFERQHTIFVHNFEYSKTGLASLVGIPTTIKNIDIISNLWPKDLRATGEHPKVSQHLSMIPASSFMHFNLDSGGSSMWYNLIKGEQIIYLVPPHEKNLNSFKEWVNKKGSEEKKKGRIPHEKKKYVSFAEIADPIIKLIIKGGESIIIPSGWSYSILTSVDSIVFSGRFLHIFSLEMQLRIHAEIDEQCPERGKYRFPYFEEMMWYLANDYVEKIQSNKSSVNGLINFSDVQLQGINLLSKWIKFYKAKKPTSIFSSQYVIDTICCFLEGSALPDVTTYQQDEEPSDSVENNNECYECNGKVESNMWVGCDICSNWFHVECAGFSKKELEELNKSEKEYICIRCSGIPDPENENDDPDAIHEKKKRRRDEIVETS